MAVSVEIKAYLYKHIFFSSYLGISVSLIENVFNILKYSNTTVSINLHGLKGAWQKAADFYVEHKRISKKSPLYRKLLRTQPNKAQLDAMKKRRKRR